MDVNIITSVITGMFVAIPSVIATVVSNNKSNALIKYRIDELTKKVEKHNSIVERTYILEEKMKVANHRIDDLEEK